MKLWSLISICFLLGLGNQAQAGSSNFELACLSWDLVAKDYSMNMTPSQVAKLKASHGIIRGMIVNADTQINKANDSGNSNQEIYLCSVLEAATSGFNNACLDDSGKNVVTDSLKEHCLSLHL